MSQIGAPEAAKAAEYAALFESAGLTDLGDRSFVEITGPDAADFLQGLVTNDVAGLANGKGCYAALLNVKGRMLADLRVLKDGERILLDLEPVALPSLIDAARMYRIGYQVEVADRSSELALVAVIGPQAQQVVGTDQGALNSFAHVELGEADCLAIVADRGRPGIDLVCPSSARGAIVSELTDRGALPVGQEAVECLRIEAGIPRYGVDMDDETFVQEAGIHERAVSFTKGCYVGQEPVARMYHRGHPNRHLRQIRLSEPVSVPAELRSGEREVGTITSLADSPRFGAVGLALVRREIEPGERVSVRSSGIDAEVVELP